MATALGKPTRLAHERRFFFWMAVAIFITAVGGFVSDILARDVWFTDFPWTVHLHAVVFSTWIIFYVIQNWLVADGRNIMLHRRLGWMGAALAALMVPLGIAGTLNAIARGSVTGIFPLGLFLAMDVLGILGFGALTFAAIRLRNHAGWHKRLMLCGTVLVIAPAVGRLMALLPLGEMTPFAIISVLMAYIVIGLAFDALVMRRIHPAYWWGAGSVALIQLMIGPIGFSVPVVAFATGLTH